jgi:hypothetical protein
MGLDGGGLGVSRTGSLPLSGGASLGITARAKIANSAAAKAIGKALPLLGPVGTAASWLLLANELAFGLSNAPDGSVVVTKNDPTVCTVAPCYEFKSLDPSASYGTREQACRDEIAYHDKSDPTYRRTFVSAGVDGPQTMTCTHNVYYKSNGAFWGQSTWSASWGWFQRQRAPYPPAFLPSSAQELADAIAAKSGWPTSSTIADVLDQAQRITGDVIDTEGPKVTGPASVEGPKSTTTNGNKTTTKQSNFDCIYVDGATVMDGGSVVCTEKTRTTDEVITPDPVTGAPVKTITIGDETIMPVKPDTPPQQTDCDKYPKSNGCRTDEYDTPTGEIPKTTKNLTFTPETWFGGGTCPADKVMTTRSGQVLKVWDWQASCGWITTYFRPVLLACASFGALMLLIPKGDA